MAVGAAVSEEQVITVMKDDFKNLEKLFDSIIEEIKEPEKEGTFINPFIVEKAKRGNVSGVAYNVASVTESVSVIVVRVSPDGMRATAKVVSHATSFKPFTESDIKRAANENGVFKGFDDEKIRDMVKKQTINTDILIAEGTPPKHGKNGRLEFNFDVSEEKSVPNISPGAEICRIRKAQKGRDGEDVRGHILRARDGTEASFPIGDGIRIAGGVATAESSGTLVFRDGKYSIVNELVINRNVNQDDGSIGFSGTIIINGGVTGNAVIRAGKGVIINGYLNNSLIEAEGTVTVNGRAINSTVTSIHGNINAGEVTDCTLSAGGGVRAEALLNCEVKCVTGIICTDGVGRIAGGSVNCAGDITCLVVGTREHMETSIIMGDVDEYNDKKIDTERRLAIVDKEISTLNDQINKLYEKKKAGTATLDDDDFITAANTVKQQKIGDRAPLIENIKELEAIITIAKSSTLRARSILYGGAIITIGRTNHIVNSDKPHATVKLVDSRIVVT